MFCFAFVVFLCLKCGKRSWIQTSPPIGAKDQLTDSSRESSRKFCEWWFYLQGFLSFFLTEERKAMNIACTHSFQHSVSSPQDCTHFFLTRLISISQSSPGSSHPSPGALLGLLYLHATALVYFYFCPNPVQVLMNGSGRKR